MDIALQECSLIIRELGFLRLDERVSIIKRMMYSQIIYPRWGKRRKSRVASSRASSTYFIVRSIALSPDNNDTREYPHPAHLSRDFWISRSETISAKVISLARPSRRHLISADSHPANFTRRQFDRPPRFTTLDDIKGLTFPLCACSLSFSLSLFPPPRQRRSTHPPAPRLPDAAAPFTLRCIRFRFRRRLWIWQAQVAPLPRDRRIPLPLPPSVPEREWSSMDELFTRLCRRGKVRHGGIKATLHY